MQVFIKFVVSFHCFAFFGHMAVGAQMFLLIHILTN